ncbi:hypothetical protein CO151_01300 [bacterium CG_4_9_14_3_um_filter_65_15]|nr:MAG: hypothetical protein CO151_01300 [bacterium CG_4_9_14_3_um_filter_65_15]
MNPRLHKRLFGMVIAVLAPAVYFAGCGSPASLPPDNYWYHLFDTEFSWVIEATPPYFTTETPIDIAITVRPRESGVGLFTIWGGYSNGDMAGTALAPVTGEIGTVVAPVQFEAGEPTRLVWRVQLNEVSPGLPYDGVRFQFYAGFDSVVVDSTMYPLGAPELTAQFGSAIFLDSAGC